MDNPNLSHFTTLSIRNCEIDSFIQQYDEGMMEWTNSMRILYDLFKESVKCRTQ